MSRPVERWLETFMCKQYADTFEAFGYKTLQSVCQLNLGHLQAMGVRPDHCEKIMENVSVLRQSYMAKNAGVPPNYPSTVDPVMSPASSALANMSRSTGQSAGGGGGYDGMGANYNVTPNEGQMSGMNYPQPSSAQMGSMSPGMQAYQRAAGLQYYRQGQNPAQMYPQQLQQFGSQSNPYLQQQHLHSSGQGPMSQASSHHDNQCQGHLQAPQNQGSMQHAHHGCQGQCSMQSPHHPCTQGPIQHQPHLPSQNQGPMHPPNQPANQGQRSMHPGNTASQAQRSMHPANPAGQSQAAMQRPSHAGSQGQGSMQPPNQGYSNHPPYGSPPVSSYSQSPSPSMPPWGGSGEGFQGPMPPASLSNAGSSLLHHSLLMNGPQTPQQVADHILHMASQHYPCNGPPALGPSVNKYRAAMGPSQMAASPMSPSPHMGVQNSPNRFPMPQQQQGNHFAYPSASPVNRTSPISPIQVRSPASVHSNQSLPTASPGPLRSPTPLVERSPAPSSVSSPGLGGMRSPSQSLQPLRSPTQAMSSPLHSMQQQTSPMSAPIMSPSHAAHFSPNSIPVKSPHSSPSSYQPCTQSHSRQSSSPLYLDSMSASYSGNKCPLSTSPSSRAQSVNPLQSLQKLVMLPESQVIDPKSVVNDACLPGSGENSKFDDVPKNCEGPDGSGKSDSIGSLSQAECLDGKHCGSDHEMESDPHHLPAIGPVVRKRSQIKTDQFQNSKSGCKTQPTEQNLAASKPRNGHTEKMAVDNSRSNVKEAKLAEFTTFLNDLKSDACVSPQMANTTKLNPDLSESSNEATKTNDKNKTREKNKNLVLDAFETTSCPKTEQCSTSKSIADVLVTSSAGLSQSTLPTLPHCSMKTESTVTKSEPLSESVKCDNKTEQECKDVSSDPNANQDVARNTSKSAVQNSPPQVEPLSRTPSADSCDKILAETKCQASSPDQNCVLTESSQHTNTNNIAIACPKEQFHNSEKEITKKPSVEITEGKLNLSTSSTVGLNTEEACRGSNNCSQNDPCGKICKEEISDSVDIRVKCPSDVGPSETDLLFLSEKTSNIKSDILDKSTQAADNKDRKALCKLDNVRDLDELNCPSLKKLKKVDSCREQTYLNEDEPADINPEINHSASGSRVEHLISLETRTNPVQSSLENDSCSVTKKCPAELCDKIKNTPEFIGSSDTKEATGYLNKDTTTSTSRESPQNSSDIVNVVAQTKSVSNDLVKYPDTTFLCDSKKEDVSEPLDQASCKKTEKKLKSISQRTSKQSDLKTSAEYGGNKLNSVCGINSSRVCLAEENNVEKTGFLNKNLHQANTATSVKTESDFVKKLQTLGNVKQANHSTPQNDIVEKVILSNSSKEETSTDKGSSEKIDLSDSSLKRLKTEELSQNSVDKISPKKKGLWNGSVKKISLNEPVTNTSETKLVVEIKNQNNVSSNKITKPIDRVLKCSPTKIDSGKEQLSECASPVKLSSVEEHACPDTVKNISKQKEGGFCKVDKTAVAKVNSDKASVKNCSAKESDCKTSVTKPSVTAMAKVDSSKASVKNCSAKESDCKTSVTKPSVTAMAKVDSNKASVKNCSAKESDCKTSVTKPSVTAMAKVDSSKATVKNCSANESDCKTSVTKPSVTPMAKVDSSKATVKNCSAKESDCKTSVAKPSVTAMTKVDSSKATVKNCSAKESDCKTSVVKPSVTAPELSVEKLSCGDTVPVALVRNNIKIGKSESSTQQVSSTLVQTAHEGSTPVRARKTPQKRRSPTGKEVVPVKRTMSTRRTPVGTDSLIIVNGTGPVNAQRAIEQNQIDHNSKHSPGVSESGVVKKLPNGDLKNINHNGFDWKERISPPGNLKPAASSSPVTVVPNGHASEGSISETISVSPPERTNRRKRKTPVKRPIKEPSLINCKTPEKEVLNNESPCPFNNNNITKLANGVEVVAIKNIPPRQVILPEETLLSGRIKRKRIPTMFKYYDYSSDEDYFLDPPVKSSKARRKRIAAAHHSINIVPRRDPVTVMVSQRKGNSPWKKNNVQEKISPGSKKVDDKIPVAAKFSPVAAGATVVNSKSPGVRSNAGSTVVNSKSPGVRNKPGLIDATQNDRVLLRNNTVTVHKNNRIDLSAARDGIMLRNNTSPVSEQKLMNAKRPPVKGHANSSVVGLGSPRMVVRSPPGRYAATSSATVHTIPSTAAPKQARNLCTGSKVLYGRTQTNKETCVDLSRDNQVDHLLMTVDEQIGKDDDGSVYTIEIISSEDEEPVPPPPRPPIIAETIDLDADTKRSRISVSLTKAEPVRKVLSPTTSVVQVQSFSQVEDWLKQESKLRAAPAIRGVRKVCTRGRVRGRGRGRKLHVGRKRKNRQDFGYYYSSESEFGDDSLKALNLNRTYNLVKSHKKHKKDSVSSVRSQLPVTPAQSKANDKYSGPCIRVKGDKVDSLSFEVVPVKEKDTKGNKKRRSRTGQDSITEIIPTSFIESVPWLCAFCGKGTHHKMLGDLFGPYYPDDKSASSPTTPALESPESKNRRKSSEPEIDWTCQTASKKDRRRSISRDSGTQKLAQSACRTSTSSCSVLPLEIWVHEDCTVWTSGVYISGIKIHGLEEALLVAKQAICSACKCPGATLGCYIKGCSQKYHYLCAKEKDCHFNEENFSLVCVKHKDKKVKMIAVS